jgi:predicted amidohydrolase
MGAKVVYYISHEAEWRRNGSWPDTGLNDGQSRREQVVVVASNAPQCQDNSGSHGQSRIIKDDGNILQEASFYGDEVLIETLQVKVGKEKSDSWKSPRRAAGRLVEARERESHERPQTTA